MTWLARATAGALVTVLLINVGYLGGRLALGAFAPSYPVNVVLGRLGQNVTSGTDVKVRGVVVGHVGDITLNDDLEAVAELVIEPQYRIPRRSTFVVTGKTLLGEKQVEVTFDGSFDEGPYLARGATVDDPARVVEFQDVLAELARLFEAIDPDDLAVVIDDGVGAFDGEGATIARSIDQGARGLDVGVRNLDDQVPSTRDLSLVAERFGTLGDEFNALGTETIRGLPTLSDNQRETRRALDALARFADVVDVTLEVERPNFDRMVVEGDSVTRMLFVYAEEVGEVLSGLNNYTSQYRKAGFQSEYTQGQAAWFEIFIQSGITDELCPELPPEMRTNLPMCTGDDPVDVPVPDLPDETDVPAAPDLPGGQVGVGRVGLPKDLVRADQPTRVDVKTLLELTLERSAAGDGEVLP